MKHLAPALTLLLALAAPPALGSGTDVGASSSPTNPDEAMPAPIAITIRGEELGRALEGAGWVHKGTGRFAFYTIGFRSCPDCIALEGGAYEKLEAAGADIRDIVYARADVDGKPRSKIGERAMVAEIWKYRDYNLWTRWHETDPETYYKTEQLPPSADSDPDRMAYVEKSRALAEQVNAILQANGVRMYVPAMFWKQNGVWMVYVGYDPATFQKAVIDRLSAV